MHQKPMNLLSGHVLGASMQVITVFGLTYKTNGRIILV